MRRLFGNILLIGGFIAFLGLAIKTYIDSKAFTLFNMDKFIESYMIFFILGSFITCMIGMGILTNVPKKD